MLSIDLHIIISSIGMSPSLKTKEFYRLIANKLFKKEGDVLNEFKEVLNLISMGREFQSFGADTEKARSP